ncbi:MAG: nucleotide-binding protein, partial [Acidobacteriota bacterium]
GGDQATDLAPRQTDAAAAAAPEVKAFSGEVLETMNAGGYPYVLLGTETEQIWAASNEFEVAVGDRVTVPIESPMADFRSETLDRSFDLIYFASRIVPEGAALGGGMGSPHGAGMGGGMVSDHAPAMGGHTTAADAGIEAGTITTPEGGLKIAAIWTDRQALSGKPVVVSGKVVKYNGGIMGTNWLHIQDGSGSAAEGTNDLTVTTATPFAVGDIVTVTGALTLDKDFGSGYRYATIILDAEVTKQ